ncbi:hypothetical protein HY407_00790 [Candidatus Gottesmanbacteria bacterium]|nr:hypothetical protein [Candidatus Gottesmanbacteria bacterium]
MERRRTRVKVRNQPPVPEDPGLSIPEPPAWLIALSKRVAVNTIDSDVSPSAPVDDPPVTKVKPKRGKKNPVRVFQSTLKGF